MRSSFAARCHIWYICSSTRYIPSKRTMVHQYDGTVRETSNAVDSSSIKRRFFQLWTHMVHFLRSSLCQVRLHCLKSRDFKKIRGVFIPELYLLPKSSYVIIERYERHHNYIKPKANQNMRAENLLSQSAVQKVQEANSLQKSSTSDKF